MNMMYSESIYRGVKPATFSDFIQNMEKDPDHIKHHKKWDVLERDEKNYPALIYTLNKMPMMTDREGIVRVTHKNLEDGSNLIITKSEDHPDYPRGKHAIRTQVFKGTMFFEKDGDLHVHEYAQFNMGGYFPMTILNKLMSTIMTKIVGEFRKKLLKRQEEMESTNSSSN